MRRPSWNRRRTGAVACGLAGAVVAAWLVTAAMRPSTPPSAAAPNPTATAPDTPPAQVCGSDTVLDGPADPPASAVVVDTSERLDKVTSKHPPDTTFWVSPGVHTLGAKHFNQVGPKDGDTYIGAPGAVLDGRHRNRYAFGGHATGVTIKHLTIQHFGSAGGNPNEGVVNHDSGTNWSIEGNTIRRNAGAAVMLGSSDRLSKNCLTRNGQYGFNAYHPDGVTDLVIQGNEISHNNTDDWEQRVDGCGCSGGGKFWMVRGAVVRGNWVHDNLSVGLWADTNNTGFTIEDNYIADNDAEGLIYETSYNALIHDNTFVRNGLVSGPENSGFPTSAIYVSESGSDTRAPGPHSSSFEISDNVFTNNWSGVILWENADRFAGSPANTSTGASTLVNSSVATAKSCGDRDKIHKKPYYNDCRWKTQNVQVHDNTFNFDPRAIGEKCTLKHSCGYNGIFSNWGTYPSWSPYKGDVIEKAITFHQNNHFSDNTYAGPWHFLVKDQSTRVNWASWQSAPYGQDVDSVIKPRASEGQQERCTGSRSTATPRCRQASPRPTGD